MSTTIEIVEPLESPTVIEVNVGIKGDTGDGIASVATDDTLLAVEYDPTSKVVTLSTNIYAGTTDAPDGLPDGSIYFRYT